MVLVSEGVNGMVCSWCDEFIPDKGKRAQMNHLLKEHDVPIFHEAIADDEDGTNLERI